MNSSPEGNFRPQASLSSGDQYLDAAIRMASPAKLRLMLLERSVEVARMLAAKWRAGETMGSNEYSIQLLDMINELLGGISGGKSESEKKLCLQVADLYVFLAKHLVIAEQHSDAGAIDEIRLVLETETETWRAVVAQEVSKLPAQSAASPVVSTSGGLNFSA
ncbi:flagellar protein FliS [Rubripirellula amarantea]|uniref:Flagellar protein FliS n=1 Tax=Rubripirellula amarantea TaxID=2527999 RepID=A0A5C5WGH6_9BACT|nr:flagellar export chaperone FliS [Rubripirellula amarantea]TWT49205.1 flagellar protein FliS [Rubripirellula amarantea]